MRQSLRVCLETTVLPVGFTETNYMFKKDFID